jgi:hypothetical protein
MTRSEGNRFPQTTVGQLAQGLGWFSIALGAVELTATRSLAGALNMRGRETLLRVYGAREIAAGVGILTAANPAPWLWSRVAGDVLDLAALATAYRTGRKQRNVALAIINVAAVTALDVMCAQELGATRRRQSLPRRDYSDRSGLPQGVAASRGLAADADIPADFRTPEPLRPYALAGTQ